MLKAYTKYILTICVLLLSVSSRSSAETHSKGELDYAAENHLVVLNCADVHTETDGLRSTFKSFSSVNREEFFFDCDEESEEKNLILHKKSLSDNNITSIFFYNWYWSIIHKATKVLFSYKDILYFSLNKLYVVFSVFRI